MTLPSTRTRPSWFYWILALFTLLQMIWFVVLLINFFMDPLAGDPQFGSVPYRLFTVFVLVPIALTVSFLVLRRAPGNVVGLCLLMWVVTVMGTGTIKPDSALYVYDQSVNVSWWGLWLLALYFPDGRSAFSRLELPIRLLTLSFLVFAVLVLPASPTWTATNSYGHRIEVANPIYIRALAPVLPFLASINQIALPFVVGSLLLLVLPSLIVKYRRSDEHTRLQIRWLAWAFAIVLAQIAVLAPTGLIAKGADTSNVGPARQAMLAFFGIYVALFPYIAVGTAILRHRLYDIDIIIRRTLIYGALSGLLLAFYFGSIVVLQQLFRTATGQGSDLAIIASTLAIAALSIPLRNRVQNVIDQRFYRRKYNAVQVLARFAETARDEVDLGILSENLLEVVQDTLRPESTSLWLRPAKDSGPLRQDYTTKTGEAGRAPGE